MNIILKTQKQIDQIEHNGKILREAVNLAMDASSPGTSTLALDKIIEQHLRKNGAVPTFKGYGGSDYRPPFPRSSCISVNDVMVHGIPSKAEKLKRGDLVSIDIGVTKEGCVADSCFSYVVGEGTEATNDLIKAAHDITMFGISLIQPGIRIHDLSKAIALKAKELGYVNMPALYGHGTGVELHEKPTIPFSMPPFNDPIPNPRLVKDMIITIEPVVTLPSNVGEYVEDKDNWTLRTIDKSWAAQFEHTVLVTSDGFRILTDVFRSNLNRKA